MRPRFASLLPDAPELLAVLRKMVVCGTYLEDGAVIWAAGVALLVGACGMEKEEDDGDGVWITDNIDKAT